MDNIFTNKLKKVHLIGIGGSSMNGIAEIIMKHGISVSGSDRSHSANTDRLEQLGARIFLGHFADNLDPDCDLVVYTLAIADDNPELLKARALGIPTVERGVFLGTVVKSHAYSLAVSGTHGKTTTTSMAAAILLAAEKDPCVHLGGFFPLINGSVRASTSPYLVTEACEYHKNLLNLSPYAGIILNVEAEHLDFYKGGLPEILDTFSAFAGKIDPQGFLVVCGDNAAAMKAAENAGCRVLTYSVNTANADFYAKDIEIDPDGSSHFTICTGAAPVARIELKVPGRHNISNALAAAAACIQFGCTGEDIEKGLLAFRGANRRFECKGKINGAPVIDDYAHHPTEIKAVLDTARAMVGNKGRIWSIFQPHTFSRAKSFGDQFCEALKGSDTVITADIYAARERDPGDINSELLVAKFKDAGINALYMPSFEDIEAYIRENVAAGDIVITLGAGDINKVAVNLTK